jgi:leucyl aminopeptidase
MDIRFQNASGKGQTLPWTADCTIVFAFEQEAPSSFAPSLWEVAPWLEISPGLRDFRAKKEERSLLYGHPENPLSRVLLCGLGSKDTFKLNLFRDSVARAVQFCRDKGFATIGLPVENLDRLVQEGRSPALPGAGLGDTGGEASRYVSREILIREAVASALLSLYRNDDWRSKKEEDSPADPRWLALLFTEKEIPDAAHRAARQGEAEAGGVILARHLSNGPGNHITPAVLAEEACKLAKAHGFACTVFDQEQIEARGMGALFAVGRGSVQGPRFIVLEHCPKGKEQDKPLVVVGKGITFDTGGISLKPAAKMHEMKGDMGGAAAVLGFFHALGSFADADELPRVVGLVPAAENMPGGNATRPGDVITTLSGKTVEILNTDAEGRLILCDALTYAQQEYTPAAVIDLATLTGASVIALGDYGSGLFTEDCSLRKAIMDGAEDTGDLVWPMPLWDEYDANLKSDVADFSNMGSREGAAIVAALFLRRFIEKGTRWAHLDIAGPGYVVKSAPLLPVAGGTGMGVRLLCRCLRDERVVGLNDKC